MCVCICFESGIKGIELSSDLNDNVGFLFSTMLFSSLISPCRNTLLFKKKDDPILKSATNNEEGNADNNNNEGKGKWRIPLGAYHTLMTYLTSSSSQHVVEGIPPEQLHAATLGRERMDKKSYATVSELRDRGVSKVVCEALAPYQRAGVEFILDKDGRALLADEMGLGTFCLFLFIHILYAISFFFLINHILIPCIPPLLLSFHILSR